jgi:hypothetical protein
MPLFEIVTSSGIGSLLGFRHALEPDHVAAVSTLVTHERSTYKAAVLGAYWGLGHTLALLMATTVLVVARTEMSASAEDLFEFFVALMLVALGIRSIAQAARGSGNGPMHSHRHGRTVHTHAGVPAHVHVGGWTLARRPLLVGLVHGLAGSGALTALVLSSLSSTTARLMYVVLFGLGSTLGMAALSGLLGWPLARLGTNGTVGRALSFVVGFVSTALGLVWGYPTLAHWLA